MFVLYLSNISVTHHAEKKKPSIKTRQLAVSSSACANDLVGIPWGRLRSWKSVTAHFSKRCTELLKPAVKEQRVFYSLALVDFSTVSNSTYIILNCRPPAKNIFAFIDQGLVLFYFVASLFYKSRSFLVINWCCQQAEMTEQRSQIMQVNNKDE